MASGSQTLTTYYAKRIIGDTNANTSANALLQTGEGIVASEWILGNNERAGSNGSQYGIVYKYDNSSNGTADKIEVYGGHQESNINVPTAWVRMDTGDLYLLGQVGIGYDPNSSGNTYKLYVNGAIATVGNIDPSVTNTYNLGGSSLVWANMYATTFHGALDGNAATATRINGNLAAATTDVNRNIWVSSTASADGIPNYISGFNMNPSTNVFTVPSGTRISPSSGALYLGNSGNQSWVYVQDMAGQDGSKWKLHQNGNAEFTGTVGTGAINANGDLNLYTSSADSPDIVWWYADKGKEQARLWMGSGFSSKTAPSFREYKSDGTSLYSGVLPLGDGTGASGTWGIDISGNAATATKLAHTTLDSTTINNTAGSFAFSGSGDPWSGSDWVGLQIGDNADKFQISARSNTLVFRQNDSGGTNTSWSDWVTMVTSANYTSYTVTKTGTGASGTWGIDISGNAATVSRATFGDSSNGEHNANNITSNGLYYYTSNGPATDVNQFKSTDGAIYCQAYSTSWVGQIAQDYRNGSLAVRAKNNGTWQAWLSIPKMKVESYPALLPANGENNWIKIGTSNTSYGLLPSQTGGAGSGHNYIGTSSWYWKYAYIDEIHGTLKGNADTATKLGTANVGSSNQPIYLNAGTATGVSWYFSSCTITGGNKANYPWHRFAYVTTGGGTYTDKDVIVIIRARFDGGRYGMIKLSTRTNASGGAKTTSATWIYRRGFEVGDVIISKPAQTTGTDETISAYVKCSTYPRCIGYIVQGSNNGWTLVSSNEPNDTTASDKKGGIEINASVSNTNAATDGATVSYANSAGSCTGNAATATKANGLADGSNTMTSAYNKSGLAYADYTWLAGWNGYELRAVNKSQFAQASHNHAAGDINSGTLAVARGGTGQTSVANIQAGKDGSGNTITSYYCTLSTAQTFTGNKTFNSICYFANGTTYYVNKSGDAVFKTAKGAVWNDYAEYRKTVDNVKPGQVVIDNDDGSLSISIERLQSGAHVVSDTYGFSIGETEKTKTPVAVSGRVLAYTYRPREEYHAGMAVCAAPNGTIDIMTRDEIMMYPERIVGTVSEIPDYEIWHGGSQETPTDIQVDGRIWIYVK